MAVLQAQINGQWREIGRCSDDIGVVANRMAQASRQYTRVKAISDRGQLLDII